MIEDSERFREEQMRKYPPPDPEILERYGIAERWIRKVEPTVWSIADITAGRSAFLGIPLVLVEQPDILRVIAVEDGAA